MKSGGAIAQFGSMGGRFHIKRKSPAPTAVLGAFAAGIEAGEPVSFENLTVVPLFGPASGPKVEPLPVAIESGRAVVTEIDEAGEVERLRVENRRKAPLLLFDGEELRGAKQNRVVNTTILVPGESVAEVPVSCVEQGRWRYRTRAFAAGSVLVSSMRRISFSS